MTKEARRTRISRHPRPGGASAKPKRVEELYRRDDIVDAPEHYEYARAMGLFTWGTWDDGERPFEDRLSDFLQAHPPKAPARFQGSMLTKTEGEYGPATSEERLVRLRGSNNSFGTLAEVLARYGLKQRSGPEYVPQTVEVSPFREITRLRNQRLRALHGRADVEAENMDEAKAVEIERLERKQAAEQIREARERMRWERGD
jgi:hypothetical protein